MGLDQAPVVTELDRLVLRLSATGLTIEEAAERLGIDPDEVRRHLAVAIAALGASSKLEAIVLAVRAGLIELA